jgi:hypothetical protein
VDHSTKYVDRFLPNTLILVGLFADYKYGLFFTCSGSGRILKLSKTFLRIYEFFENSENSF